MVLSHPMKLLKKNGRPQTEQIYCRRSNRLYLRCPFEHDLRSCECLHLCEMAAHADRAADSGSDGLRG